MIHRAFATTILLATLITAPGCGGAAGGEGPEPVEVQGLRNLGLMYKMVSDALARPPKTIDELRKAEAQFPGGFSDIGENNVAIYLGASLSDGDPSDILAYDRVAPLQGGYVLTRDGGVKKLTAAEFKAAKKAGSKPWTAPSGS